MFNVVAFFGGRGLQSWMFSVFGDGRLSNSGIVFEVLVHLKGLRCVFCANPGYLEKLPLVEAL